MSTNAEVWLFNLVTKPSLLLLLTSFMLSTAKSITLVYSFSFTLTRFDNSPAIGGLTAFTGVNSGMHMTMHSVSGDTDFAAQKMTWSKRLSEFCFI